MGPQFAMVAITALAASSLVMPAWDDPTFRRNGTMCVRAPPSGTGALNHRTTFFALPPGKAPKAGWPVYMYFPPWSVPGKDGVPCDPSIPPPLLPSCTAFLRTACPDSAPAGCEPCVRHAMQTAPGYAAASCPAAGTAGGDAADWMWCRGHGSYPKDPVFEPPATIGNGCFVNGTTGGFLSDTCDFGAMAGMMWDMRSKQVLLANGVAVLQVNPAQGETWDWYGQKTWDEGSDKPYFASLFGAIRDGTAFGGAGASLDLDRLVVSGYSVGAQMSSWFFQLHVTGQLDGLATVVGGVFFAGGTYGCYQEGPLAMAQCSGCNASAECLQIGCSQDLAKHNITPCCQYCCPEAFTEQHYADHPEDYATHPPAFFVQHSTIDENADSCAARNYHAEMQKHGGDSTMVLIPAEQERCYCLGDPAVPADAGSPFTETCGTPPSGFLPGIGKTSCTLPSPAARANATGRSGGLSECQGMGPGSDERCIAHTMGFGGMVTPLAQFVARLTQHKSQTP